MWTSELSGNEVQEKKYASKFRSISSGKWVFFLLLGCLVAGMMYGSILLQDGTGITFEQVAKIQQAALEKRKDGFLQLFWSSIWSLLIFFGASFLFGFSAIGQPFTVLLPFFRGLAMGSCIGYWYLYGGASGFMYSGVVMLPGMVVAAFGLVLSCRESIRFSNSLMRSLWKGDRKLSKAALQLYLLKHVVLLGFLLMSALLDGVMAALFSRFFHFS